MAEILTVASNNRCTYCLFDFEDFRRFLCFSWIGFRFDFEPRQSRDVARSLTRKNLSGIDAGGGNGRPVNGAVRNKLPPAVALRVDPFKPDRRQTAGRVWISILWHEQTDVPSVGDRQIAMHLDLNVVEIVNEVLLLGNSFEEGRFIVFHSSGLLASHPSIAMTE